MWVSLISKGAISKSGAVLSLFTGLATFSFTDYLTEKLPLAVIVSAVCTVIVASIKTKPRRIEAEAAAAMGVVERMDKLHHEQIKYYHERMTQQNKLIAILTITKHGLAGENQALRDHCRVRGELLDEANIKFVPVSPRDFSELFKQEDIARAEIAGLPPALVQNLRASGKDTQRIAEV